MIQQIFKLKSLTSWRSHSCDNSSTCLYTAELPDTAQNPSQVLTTKLQGVGLSEHPYTAVKSQAQKGGVTCP